MTKYKRNFFFVLLSLFISFHSFAKIIFRIDGFVIDPSDFPHRIINFQCYLKNIRAQYEAVMRRYWFYHAFKEWHEKMTKISIVTWFMLLRWCLRWQAITMNELRWSKMLIYIRFSLEREYSFMSKFFVCNQIVEKNKCISWLDDDWGLGNKEGWRYTMKITKVYFSTLRFLFCIFLMLKCHRNLYSLVWKPASLID